MPNTKFLKYKIARENRLCQFCVETRLERNSITICNVTFFLNNKWKLCIGNKIQSKLRNSASWFKTIISDYFILGNYYCCIYLLGLRVMVFNATFNNISVISWGSCSGIHLAFKKNIYIIYFEKDYQMTIHVQFGFNHVCSFLEEDTTVFPMWLYSKILSCVGSHLRHTINIKKHNLYRSIQWSITQNIYIPVVAVNLVSTLKVKDL